MEMLIVRDVSVLPQRQYSTGSVNRFDLISSSVGEHSTQTHWILQISERKFSKEKGAREFSPRLWQSRAFGKRSLLGFGQTLVVVLALLANQLGHTHVVQNETAEACHVKKFPLVARVIQTS